jgi:hypothetical protein
VEPAPDERRIPITIEHDLSRVIGYAVMLKTPRERNWHLGPAFIQRGARWEVAELGIMADDEGSVARAPLAFVRALLKELENVYRVRPSLSLRLDDGSIEIILPRRKKSVILDEVDFKKSVPEIVREIGELYAR